MNGYESDFLCARVERQGWLGGGFRAGKAAGADAGFGTRGRLVKQVQSHLCAEW